MHKNPLRIGKRLARKNLAGIWVALLTPAECDEFRSRITGITLYKIWTGNGSHQLREKLLGLLHAISRAESDAEMTLKQLAEKLSKSVEKRQTLIKTERERRLFELGFMAGFNAASEAAQHAQEAQNG